MCPEATNDRRPPRLYRVILPVDDIERVATFYAELLRLPGVRVSPGRHYFDCSGVILALYDPKADGDTAIPRPNPEHVYFAVANLEAVYERAEHLGGLSTETGDGNLPMGKIAQRPWGERSFYMHDPSGNPLCFVDETSVFTGDHQSSKKPTASMSDAATVTKIIAR
jgi:catechol 2,3-dioxygenase-like lactoylglutathione lyase family enzyme